MNQAIFRRWLPLSEAVLRMVVRCMPSPLQAQNVSNTKYLTMYNNTNTKYLTMYNNTNTKNLTMYNNTNT